MIKTCEICTITNKIVSCKSISHQFDFGFDFSFRKSWPRMKTTMENETKVLTTSPYGSTWHRQREMCTVTNKIIFGEAISHPFNLDSFRKSWPRIKYTMGYKKEILTTSPCRSTWWRQREMCTITKKIISCKLISHSFHFGFDFSYLDLRWKSWPKMKYTIR